MNEGTCVAFGSAVRLTGSPGGSACNVGVAVASLTGIPLSFKVEDELPDLPDCEDVPLDVVLAVYDTGATPEPIAGVGAVLLPRNVPGALQTAAALQTHPVRRTEVLLAEHPMARKAHRSPLVEVWEVHSSRPMCRQFPYWEVAPSPNRMG